MCIVHRCLYYIYRYTVLFVHLFVKVYGVKSLKIGRQKPTMFSMSKYIYLLVTVQKSLPLLIV